MEKRLVYVILFPDKRVFIGQTYKSIEEKIEYQKQDLNDRGIKQRKVGAKLKNKYV